MTHQPTELPAFEPTELPAFDVSQFCSDADSSVLGLYHKAVKDTVGIVFRGVFAANPAPQVPPLDPIASIRKFADLFEEQKPRVHAELGPGVLEDLRAALPVADSRPPWAPPVKWWEPDVQLHEVYVLAPGAWQLVDDQGTILSGSGDTQQMARSWRD